MAYAELDITSNFSFLKGASHPAELVMEAKALGLSAIGIADINTLSGIVRAYAAAEECKQDLRVGSRLELTCGMTLLVYPKTLTGYSSLSRLLTLGKRRAVKGSCALQLDDVIARLKDCVVILKDPVAFQNEISALLNVFEQDFYIGMAAYYDGWDTTRFAQINDLAATKNILVVALGGVLMHDAKRRRIADILTCIRLGKTIDQIGQNALLNAERRLKPEFAMRRLFVGYSEAIRNTLRIAETCKFRLSEIKYEYPDEVLNGIDPDTRLRQLTEKGLVWRYPGGVALKTRALVEKELALIARLSYAPYFLTVQDIVAYARGQGILCQGRGSAANSVVCFALGITEASPDVINMVFERFISEVRNEPPDIDVDFEHERREEVIQYIFRKYGRERAAICSTVIHFRTRSAIRETAKAMGLSEDNINDLTSQVWGWRDGALSKERAKGVGLDPAARRVALTLEIAKELTGFPRHLSQHTGGFVITNQRLDALCPIENAAMEDRTIIEWDKNDIDVMGMMKIDVLALGMLTCIRKGFDMLRQWKGLDVSIASVPQEDSDVYDMICVADTLGVFQIESRAQMQFLPRMRPRTFYDLIIEVAIIRPGPIQGDMVHPYLKRRRGEEEVIYPSDDLKPALEKTLGIPLFQEQAMEIASIAAGFTASEADHLRRSLASSSGPGRIQIHKERFIKGCIENGYQLDFAEAVFRQLEGFSGYGFPQSHAASFALIVYVSCWLKCHHPEVFGCALLNSQPMGFYAPAQIVQDMERHNIRVLPVSIEHSYWDCTLEPDGDGALAVRLGYRQIKGMPEQEARWITAARGNGYQSIDAVWRRAGITQRALSKLAHADAFHCYGLNRREALWQVKALPRTGALPLFAAVGEGLPDIASLLPELTKSQQVYEDYVATRLTLREHPVALLSEQLGSRTLAKDVRNHENNSPVIVTGLVVTRQRPGTASGVIFLTLEDDTGVSNIIVWNTMFEKYRAEVMAGRLLRIYGTLQREGIVTHIISERIEDVSYLLDSLGDGTDKIYPAHDNADHVRSPVNSSTTLSKNQKASHVPKPARPKDQADRSKDRKTVSGYYAHGSGNHPRSQARKLFPSRDFH
ncbi:error-prone DNA polymerase [Hellea sp.]|nr:error-prone DNA polymerase [Hellea sp.]